MEAKPLLLITEDDKELALLTAEHLWRAGIETAICNSAFEAMAFVKKRFVNLILLDIGLPDMDGLTFLEELKKNNWAPPPVILVTGNHSTQSIVHALELGGDDYITKPFHFSELIARVHAVLRRSETLIDQRITENTTLLEKSFTFCGAIITPSRMEAVFPNGQAEALGRKEIGILHYLHENRDAILSRRAIIHSVWGVHANPSSRSIDQYILKIRKVFARHDCKTEALRTIREVGYLYQSSSL